MVELPRDVWYTIVSDYFEGDARTLRCLSLVSRAVSDLSLDFLWRELPSLRPFRTIINSSNRLRSTQTDVLAEEGGTKNEWDWWVDPPNLTLREPLSDPIRRRVKNYLPRIQKLAVDLNDPWDTTLRFLLTTCADSWGALLPNLRHLHLSYPTTTRTSDAYTLLPVLSPSLQTFEVHILGTPLNDFQGAIMTLFNLVKTLACEVDHISYSGPDNQGLFSTLSQFAALRTLAISHDESATRDGTLWTARDFTSSFASLVSLSLDLGAFPVPLAGQSRLRQRFLALESLRLNGTVKEMVDFLGRVNSMSVRRVTLAFNDRGASFVPYKSCFVHLYSAFSDACDLSLEFRGVDDTVCLLYQHLTPLLHMRIKRFSLLQTTATTVHHLRAEDVCALAQAWPSLEAFSLLSWTISYDAHPVLSTFSQLCHLKKLEIYLDFKALLQGRPDTTSSPMTWCPLEDLDIDFADNLPGNGRGAELLADRLLGWFPRLKLVSFGGYEANIVQERMDTLGSFRTQGEESITVS